MALVDPLIGSSNGGNTYPGAVRPFGMLSFSPTSTAGDQTNTGTYWSSDQEVDSLVRQATVPHPDGLSSYGCPGQCIGQRPNLAEYQQTRNADGSWVSGFTPSTQTGFAQGSSATYTWMIPR